MKSILCHALDTLSPSFSFALLYCARDRIGIDALVVVKSPFQVFGHILPGFKVGGGFLVFPSS